MKISYSYGKFYCADYYSHVKTLSKSGFHFNPATQRYETDELQFAGRLREYFDENLKDKIKSISLTPMAARKTLKPLDLPMTLEVRPDQFKAAEFALNRNHSYFAMRMRLGKTGAAILTLNAIPGLALVTVPPHMVPKWLKDLNEWDTRGRKWQVLNNDSLELLPNVDVILPHTFLDSETIRFLLRDTKFKHGIIDEAHRFKNPEAKRTKALLGEGFEMPGLIHKCERHIWLSGTPWPSRTLEIYPVLKASAYNLIDFRNYYSFGNKYCGPTKSTFKGWDRNLKRPVEKAKVSFLGSSNSEELREKLKDFMFFKLDHDGINYEEMAIPLSGKIPTQLRNLEREVLGKHTLQDLLKRDLSKDHFNKVMGEIAEYRQKIGIYKVKKVLPILKDQLEVIGEPILVFAWHKEVIKELHKGLKKFKPVVIDSSKSNEERFLLEQKFQKGETQLAILNIGCVEGREFSRANTVFFVEYDWVPGVNEQAWFRAVHDKKKEEIIVNYFVAENTLDEYQLESRFRKTKNIKRLTKRSL